MHGRQEQLQTSVAETNRLVGDSEKMAQAVRKEMGEHASELADRAREAYLGLEVKAGAHITWSPRLQSDSVHNSSLVW